MQKPPSFTGSNTSSSSSGPQRPGYQNRGRNNDPYAHIRRNLRIKAPQVRVIDPDGKQLGVMTSDQAYKLALQIGLDLVEVAPNAVPPVCRILDFGKYIYEENKKTKTSKSSATKIKEIELTARIDPHDLMTKLTHAEEFLHDGNKVKMRLKFRGREMAHVEIGFAVVHKAIAELANVGHPDSEPKLAGRNIMVMVSPLPANKRKLRLNAEVPEPAHAPKPAAPAAPVGQPPA
ncbi:MAG: translation initiation factor IF-3 [Opitutaceae bacterium]|nr:translation initiation factor IF-3 [Opitutaceae bacterium]